MKKEYLVKSFQHNFLRNDGYERGNKYLPGLQNLIEEFCNDNPKYRLQSITTLGKSKEYDYNVIVVLELSKPTRGSK